jgi:enamine deaminase RidA (YjgF/YER057c/UK114 family)
MTRETASIAAGISPNPLAHALDVRRRGANKGGLDCGEEIMVKSIGLGCVLALAASAASAAEIVRHPNANPAPILAAVTVPAGAETLHLSGAVPSPVDPSLPREKQTYGDTYTQALSTFAKIEATLKGLGWSMKDVVKLNVYLVAPPGADGMDFAGFNRAYGQHFGTAGNPNLVARTTMEIAGLANPAFLVEIEAVAARTAPPAK